MRPEIGFNNKTKAHIYICQPTHCKTFESIFKKYKMLKALQNLPPSWQLHPLPNPSIRMPSITEKANVAGLLLPLA